MRGDEDLVVLAEGERSEHAVHARRGVGHEDQVLGGRTDGLGEPLPRGVEQFRHLPYEELHGPRFHLVAELLLPLEDSAGQAPNDP